MIIKFLKKFRKDLLRNLQPIIFIPTLILTQIDLINAEELYKEKSETFHFSQVKGNLISYEIENSKKYPPNSLSNNCTWNNPHFFNKDNNVRFCILHNAGEIYTVDKYNNFRKFANLNKLESVAYRKECHKWNGSNENYYPDLPDFMCVKVDVQGKQVYKIVGNSLYKFRCGNGRERNYEGERLSVTDIKCWSSLQNRYIHYEKIGDRFF